jgi:hypothetical protein
MTIGSNLFVANLPNKTRNCFPNGLEGNQSSSDFKTLLWGEKSRG